MTRIKQNSEPAIRGHFRSPGRPTASGREGCRRFWARISLGLSSEEAAIGAGISSAVGVRWFRQSGGMAPSHLCPSASSLSGRYLSFAEREEIALLHAQGQGVRLIARQLHRSPSTISRELRRNAATGAGTINYRATTAQWHADRAGRRPKPAKLAIDPRLRDYVQHRLSGMIAGPDGIPVPGPMVPWKGRRHGPRQDRRWATA